MSFDNELLTAAIDPGAQVYKDEPLRLHTTFMTGGAADFYIEVKSPLNMGVLVDILDAEDMPYFIIGRGSNILASDDGYRGVVIKPAFNAVRQIDDTIEAEAGAQLSAVCAFAAARGLSGLEFACGIPGTVGGAVMMNAGAYGHEISDVLISAIIFDKGSGFDKVGAISMGLSYRYCARLEGGSLLYKAQFQMREAEKSQIRGLTEDILAKRRAAQPLELPSAGSVFKRPKGHYAGKLIEDCGLKGFRIGGAEVSPKHAGFIVNTGGATSSDIYAVMRHVRRVVADETGVELEPEVRFLGDFPEW